MTIEKQIEALQKQLQQVDELHLERETGSSSKFVRWREATKRRIERSFGEESEHFAKFNSISYASWIVSGDEYTQQRIDQESFLAGLEAAKTRLLVMIDELTERLQAGEQVPSPPPSEISLGQLSIPYGLLYPEIDHRCSMHFQTGSYDDAILNALKVVEDKVRQATGLRREDIGVKLMQKAFNPNSPMLTYSTVTAEQEGAMALFRGAIACFKNPHSHRFVDIEDPVQTFEILCFASTLCRIVDAIIDRVSNWSAVWQELRGNIAKQPPCPIHPEHPHVKTLAQGVINDVVEIGEEGIIVRSHRTLKEDFIAARRFEVWWNYLVTKGRASLSPHMPDMPQTGRGRIVGAILATCLSDKIRAIDHNTIELGGGRERRGNSRSYGSSLC